jgi:hypothetical protein
VNPMDPGGVRAGSGPVQSLLSAAAQNIFVAELFHDIDKRAAPCVDQCSRGLVTRFDIPDVSRAEGGRREAAEGWNAERRCRYGCTPGVVRCRPVEASACPGLTTLTVLTMFLSHTTITCHLLADSADPFIRPNQK